MDHHTNWFKFLPFYNDVSHSLETPLGPIGGAGSAEHGAAHIFGALLVAFVLMFASLLVSSHFRNTENAVVPGSKLGLRNLFELFVETLAGMMEGIIGHDYQRYLPMIGTLALFIISSNLLGLIPGFVPPTDNFNTTFALGIAVFVWFNFHGLRVHGFGHIEHLAMPAGRSWLSVALLPILFPIEVFSLFLRPLTLALRLAANMIADHAVLFAISGLFALFIPLPFFGLGLLVCTVQTAVFCILSTVYIALHTAEAHH